MTITQTIALIAGALTAAVALCGALWLLIFGGLFPDEERLIFVSIALGPVIMFAVMAGYAVWWFVMFVLSLVLPREESAERPQDPKDS
ncbi:MAG: hypothetical protein RDU20_11285 [Desulfomonilaceae bacterium]|nr:hypothetical protein [Desulfomonilaceae bacterium]